jgi:beta-N-acetylhexosaminidase
MNYCAHKKEIPVIFGVKSTTLLPEEIEFFRNYSPVGFILFARNIESREQVKALTSDLSSLSTKKLILIDQEGGRVCRLKFPIFRECPPAKYFGDMYQEYSPEKAISATYDNYYMLMKGLLELGINVNTVPVADLIHPGAHIIVGNRSFSSDIGIVTNLCSAVIEATIDAGGYSVIKHLPGHGRAILDSHEALPFVDTDLESLEKTDFVPFRSLALMHKGNDRIFGMSAHIVFRCLDDDHPATLSPKVMQYVREELDFQFDIMTDDICMKALSSNYADITRSALAAGCNIILHCSGELEEMQMVSNAF